MLKATGFTGRNMTHLRTWSGTADRAELGTGLGGNLNTVWRGQMMFAVSMFVCCYKPVSPETEALIALYPRPFI